MDNLSLKRLSHTRIFQLAEPKLAGGRGRRQCRKILQGTHGFTQNRRKQEQSKLTQANSSKNKGIRGCSYRKNAQNLHPQQEQPADKGRRAEQIRLFQQRRRDLWVLYGF
ncbi:hypothetical protein SLEP1_g56941 [Rubroshorea leprosula]|uniref:Uncharacterized protein n=1 Tax=Rubroshorea leprosula TaxID=152421 RepID=A0AAV5MMJ2_9ROSI|nr:hypothetical protein SLEP1_g56941 [Rubroshorea leprosula]